MIGELKKNTRETLKLALPVIIGQLGQVLMGTIDVMMLGKVGYVHVSAAGLANSIMILVTVIGMGTMSVIAPLIAEANATADKEKVRAFLQQGIWIGFLIGGIIHLMLYFGAPLIHRLDQPPADTSLAIDFLKIISASVIPMLLFLALKGFTDGLSDTRPAMVITLLGLGLNIFLNFLLIEGNWGFPRMEIKGSALATTLTRYIMFGMMAFWVLTRNHYQSYVKIKVQVVSNSRAAFSKILSIGLPSGMQYFFEVGSFVGITIMLGWMGEQASQYRAAHQIGIAVVSISYMIALGVSTAASIRVGDALGRKDNQDIRNAGFVGLLIAILWMGLCMIFLLFGGDFILMAYQITDEVVLKTAGRLLVIGAFFQLFDGAQAVGLGILRGIQDVKYPTIVTFIAYWVLTIPLGYFLGFTLNMKVEGTWYAFLLGLGFAAVFNNLRFHLLTRSKDN